MEYQPLYALILFLVLSMCVMIFIWPEKGLWFRLQKLMQNNQRIRLEDALKHIFECERTEQVCTITSIAGTLEVSAEQVTEIIDDLRKMKLADLTSGTIKLTSEGTEYALKMIRFHRLWERYLADNTGLPETSWHQEADILEHKATESEMEQLNHELGYPRYDPHGDPIPTEKGYLPPEKGIVLTEIKAKSLVKVIHIEDQPELIYSELIKKGIYSGMKMEVLQRENDAIKLKAEGVEFWLDILSAANIQVVQIAKDEEKVIAHENLTDLKIGEQAEVVTISPVCRGLQRRRLMDLGILPGTIVSAEMKSLGGDPTAFNVRGAKIALRRSTAEMIKVKRLKEVA